MQLIIYVQHLRTNKSHMKKLILSLIALITLYTTAKAQAGEVRTTFNKTEQPAIAAEYGYDADLVDKAITDDLRQRGFGKGKSSKGYTLYQGINFNDISPDKIDLYYKVERKSKKDKDRTIITVLVSKGYDNFITSATEAKLVEATIKYVNGLQPKFVSNNLEQQIKDQEDLVKKEEKKANNLGDDGTDLEKKKRKIEEDIATNKNDQAKQKSEVEKQRQVLETLKGQRKN